MSPRALPLPMTPRDPDRRRFLKLGGVAIASIPLHALAACSRNVLGQSSSLEPRRDAHPYGQLIPIADEATGLPLLWLPAGFRYRSFGWTGDLLSDGTRTPAQHDGMAAFDAGDGRVRLVRNHELRSGRSFAPGATYDPGAGGGTTTVELEANTGEVTAAWASLVGTAVNCAGGPDAVGHVVVVRGNGGRARWRQHLGATTRLYLRSASHGRLDGRTAEEYGAVHT